MKNALKKLPFHPAFFLLLIWFSISGKVIDFIVFFIVLLVHEIGHYLVAKKLGYKLSAFYLTPCGAKLSYEEHFFSYNDEIKVALAGPFFNLSFAVIFTSLWWVFPSIYSLTFPFVYQSIFLALFNLLPAFPLDGGRAVVALFSNFVPRVKVLKISKINNLIFSGIFLIMFIVSCFVDYNPTLALVVVFLLLGLLDVNKEVKYELSYFYKKINKNFSKARIYYVNENVSLCDLIRKIEKNKFTLFYVEFNDSKSKILEEKNIIKLSVKYPLNTKLCEIFNKKTANY